MNTRPAQDDVRPPTLTRRRSSRRTKAFCRLQRSKISKAIRRQASGLESGTTLTKLAHDTIKLIDERIGYWSEMGDQDHVERLRAIKEQLVATYGRG